MRRVVLFLLLLIALPSLAQRDFTAAPDSERTDVWFDPADPGWSLTIAPSGAVSSALLTDFDVAGNPRWWFGGAVREAPGVVALDLYRPRWNVAAGRLAGATPSGNLRFRRSDEDHATLDMLLDGRVRRHALLRFVVNRDFSVGDRSGFWFDPLEGGHGQMLIQQGDWLGSIAVAYDRLGEPTWSFAQGTIGAGVLQAQRIYRRITSPGMNFFEPGGQIDVLFPGQDDAAASITLSDANGLFWYRQQTLLTRYTAAPNSRPHASALARFGSDSALAGYFVQTVARNPYNGLDGCIDFSPGPPPAQIASTTNLQEAGVDEHDEMKRLGDRLFSIRQQVGGSAPSDALLRVHGLSGSDGGMQLQHQVAVTTVPYAQLVGVHLLARTPTPVLVVIASTQAYYAGFDDLCGYSALTGKTWAIVYDVHANGLPVERTRLELDGAFATSRRIDDVLYLATADVVKTDAAGVAVYPQWRSGQGAFRSMVNVANTWLPNYAPDAWERTLTTVTKFDVDDVAPQFSSVFSRVDTSYVSPTSWYLATTQYRNNSVLAPALIPYGRVLDIHKLGLGALDYRGSGSVFGGITSSSDDSFRFSELGAHLRVLTDAANTFQSNSLFRLSVLKEDFAAKKLVIVAQLPNAARPEPIGPANEQPHGVRFHGDVVYAVSFRQTDPLYAIDLSNPLDPKLDSALEVPGYSEYLHALPGGWLFGFGLDARPGTNGLKFSLFDQRDRNHPVERWQRVVGSNGSWSSLLADHRAFAIVDLGGGQYRVAIPVDLAEGTPQNPWMPSPWRQSGLAVVDIDTNTGTVGPIKLPAAWYVEMGQQYGDYSHSARSLIYGDSVFVKLRGQWYGARVDQTLPMRGPF